MVAQVDSLYLRTRIWKLWSRLISYGLFEGRPLTTRGQWINPLVFAHFALEKWLPQLKTVQKPVFVLGTGRSGTTILGIVLSMHREVGFLNEPKALWHAIYPEEDLIGSYSRGLATYRLDAKAATPKVKHAAKRLFGAYLAVTFSRRVVDKYPELIFRVPFVREIFPDAQFIFLVRNGWDTCASINAWSTRLGDDSGEEAHDWWGADRRKWMLLVEQIVPEHIDLVDLQEEMLNWTSHTDMAAVEWIITMREGLSLLKDYPDNIIRVNFEELSVDSEKALLSISDFLDLPNDDIFMKYGHETLRPVKRVKPFGLHSGIKDIFDETMKKLGYESY